MKLKNLLLIALTALFVAACSIKHPIADDYRQYLANNKNTNNLPQLTVNTFYSIDSNTENHRYEFRAATVGYAHLWIVEFGKMLEATLDSDDVQLALGGIKKADLDPAASLVRFRLENYEFKNHMAHITLNIHMEQQGNVLLNKTYHALGKSQGAKMFWGGPFAMKNATQQSTKIAMDEILRDFINDMNAVIIKAG